METLKSIGGCLLAIAGFAALLALAVLFFLGVGWVSAHVLPLLIRGCVISTAALTVLLPLSAIKRARGFTSVTILVISYIFGITAWMDALLVTLSTWGVIAAIIGLCLMGIGVVPIGMLAALFHGQWAELLSLVVLLVLTFGCRYFSIWLSEKTQTYDTSQTVFEDDTSFDEQR